MNCDCAASGGVLQPDDRQVLLSGMKGDFQCQFRAGIAAHQGPWFAHGEPRGQRGARFKPRAMVGGKVAGVTPVRRPAAEPGVRAALVVPVRGGGQLAAGWQWPGAVELGATGFASATGRLTFRPVAGKNGAWYIEGDAVPLRGRFSN